MKKTVIALAIAGLAAASVAQAAPQANTFYVGAKAGWASAHRGVSQWEKAPLNQEVHKAFRHSVTYGVFGGYQITDNFAVELGYDDFGRVKTKKDGALVGKHTNHGAHLSLKASYPILDNLDVYGRLGAALIRSDYKMFDGKQKSHSLKVSPVLAAGFEYAIIPSLALRLEYQWISKVGDYKRLEAPVKYKPSIGSVTAGLSYRFGQSAPVAPVVVDKTFSLNSDVTFAFAKASLKPEAQEVLDGIYNELAQVNSANINVAGYTDRIGSDAYNMKLSQDRASTVANYLVAKGIAQDAISATGYGKANSVTGNKCDSVKARKALIACLADDRRVEISVKGTK